MAGPERNQRLKKELRLFDIFALATGATISGGFFLLPGIAAAQVGPALALVYLLAALPLIPGIFAQVELATAMPRAGGMYYFVDRSLGPLFGTVGGIGVWLVMLLKSAFALIGLGAYLRIFFPELPIIPVAIALAVFFGGVNLLGASKTGLVQALLLAGVLTVLIWFTGAGMGKLNFSHFNNLLGAGPEAIIATAGLLSTSYIGLSKVSSIAEEVHNPERNLPLGIFLALGTVLIVYALGAIVMTGVVPQTELSGSLVPVAITAEKLGGRIGASVVTFAAVMAFSSVANAGILSASRFPLAMARDDLVPPFFRKLSNSNVPVSGVILTTVVIIVALLFLDAAKTAKLAGAFQLIMFALLCVAVIVMREARIDAYDPSYRSPLYPYLHILGVLVPLWLVTQMGAFTILFSIGMVLAGVFWFQLYARKRIQRSGAIYHIFARLGEKRQADLDRELRGIMKEKGLRKGDPFDDMITRAAVLDIPDELAYEEIVLRASEVVAERIGGDGLVYAEQFLQGTRVGATPVSHGTALPHIRLPVERPEVVIVRAQHGVEIELLKEFWGEDTPTGKVYALFFLVGPEENAAQHLRILAQIAETVDAPEFITFWLAAHSEQGLKEILLRDERFLSILLAHGEESGRLIERALRTIAWPAGALVAMIHREGEIIIPRGDTVLQAGDRLTVIGEPGPIRKLKKEFQIGTPPST